MKLLRHVIIIFLSVLLSGCATVPYRPPRIPQRISGIYHQVQKGETLWRISKAYRTDMKEIARLNRLPDASRINEGQMIFIPYARERIEASGTYAKEDTFIWPLKGRVISFFGSLKDGVRNKGIDIGAREGMHIVASRSGKASFCEEKVRGFGKTVIIDHGNGYSTVYAHVSRILIKAGDRVKQGQVIAKVGQTGRAKRPSLHFEIRKQHRPENPFYYLP